MCLPKIGSLLKSILSIGSLARVQTDSHATKVQTGDNSPGNIVNQSQTAGDNSTLQIAGNNLTVRNETYNLYNQQSAQNPPTFVMSPQYKSINDPLEWKTCAHCLGERYFEYYSSLTENEFLISEIFYLDETSKQTAYAIIALGKEPEFLSFSHRSISVVLINQQDNSVIEKHPNDKNKEQDNDLLSYYLLKQKPCRGAKCLYPFSPAFIEEYKTLLRIREENRKNPNRRTFHL